MTLRIDAEALLFRCNVPKETMAIILCHLLKERMRTIKKGPSPSPCFLMHHATRAFRKQSRVLLLHPKGTALTLLKTQYAKKPKNPV